MINLQTDSFEFIPIEKIEEANTNEPVIILGKGAEIKATKLIEFAFQIPKENLKNVDSVEKKDVFKKASQSIKDLSESIETFYGPPKRYGKGDRRKNKLKFKNQFR